MTRPVTHFFPRFSRAAATGPLGDALRATGVRHRIIASEAQQTYRYRILLLLVGYPRLAMSALATAWRSMVSRHDSPDAAVISSDVEVIIFSLVRSLPFAAKPCFVFVPFIYTERASPSLNALRLAYYRFVVRRISLAVCHSSLEVKRYESLFSGCGVDFVFVPWGGYVPSVAAPPGSTSSLDGVARVVSAGRSGRDYPTLVASAKGLPCKVTIICNAQEALGGVVPTDQVEISMRCFGADYLTSIREADIVVVPLKVHDISAGQMVLIQAMALSRPLVVTDTPTIRDYLDDDIAVLVPPGGVVALRSALQRLMNDSHAAAEMGRRAAEVYRARFSLDAHLHALIGAIEKHLIERRARRR